MNSHTTRKWPRRCLVLGLVLMLAGLSLYSLQQTERPYAAQLQQAERLYQSGNYTGAITVYQRLLERSTTLLIRLNTLLFGPLTNPDRLQLRIAMSHDRLAATALQNYQQVVQDPRVTSHPDLTSIQRALTIAIEAYNQVGDADPRADVAARTNAARAEAQQLLLAATYAPTPGRRSLSQLTTETIHRAAKAVESAYQNREHLERQEWITPILLLEGLTRFSHPPQPQSAPATLATDSRVSFGDLLLQDSQELTDAERQRFQEFFFALPLKASDPWPATETGAAGSGGQPSLH